MMFNTGCICFDFLLCGCSLFTLNGIVQGLIQNVGFKILVMLLPIWATPDVGTDDGPLCAEVKEGQVHAAEENTNTWPRQIQVQSRKYRHDRRNKWRHRHKWKHPIFIRASLVLILEEQYRNAVYYFAGGKYVGSVMGTFENHFVQSNPLRSQVINLISPVFLIFLLRVEIHRKHFKLCCSVFFLLIVIFSHDVLQLWSILNRFNMLQFCASSKVDDDLLFSVDTSEKPSEGRSWEATSNEIVFVCFCSFRFSKWRKKNLLSSSPMSAMDHIVTPSKVEIGYFKRERILTKLISVFYSAAVERKKTQRRKNRFFVFFLHRLKFNLSARLLSALYRFQLSCQL